MSACGGKKKKRFISAVNFIFSSAQTALSACVMTASGDLDSLHGKICVDFFCGCGRLDLISVTLTSSELLEILDLSSLVVLEKV